MMGVAVGDGRLKLDVDAVLRKQKLIILFEPQSAHIVLPEDRWVSGRVLVSLNQREVCWDEVILVGELQIIMQQFFLTL